MTQLIPNAIQGADVIIGTLFLQLFAQVFQVGIDEVERVGGIYGIAAQVLGNGFLGEHAAGVGQQVEQQVVLLAGEGEGSPRTCTSASSGSTSRSRNTICCWP